MRLFNKVGGISLLSLTLLLGACGNGGDAADASNDSSVDKKIVLKMGSITQADSQLSVTMSRIGEELQERTDGRISAEQYPAGQLGNEADMLQQLNTGSLDMAVITTAQLSTSSEAFGSWLMPFIVENHEQAYELWTSEESMSLFDTLENENVKGLGYSSSGIRYILSTTPIDSVSKLSGLKLRTTPSPTITDFWNGVKASPTAMPLTEVYTALQTKVIEGIDIDTESLVNENLTEIAKYMTPSKHMYWLGGILINNDLWESLSEEDQALLQEVVAEVEKENAEQVAENEQGILDNGESELGITIVDLDASEFDEVTNSVRKTWSEKDSYIEKFLKKADEIKSK